MLQYGVHHGRFLGVAKNLGQRDILINDDGGWGSAKIDFTCPNPQDGHDKGWQARPLPSGVQKRTQPFVKVVAFGQYPGADMLNKGTIKRGRMPALKGEGIDRVHMIFVIDWRLAVDGGRIGHGPGICWGAR